MIIYPHSVLLFGKYKNQLASNVVEYDAIYFVKMENGCQHRLSIEMRQLVNAKLNQNK